MRRAVLALALSAPLAAAAQTSAIVGRAGGYPAGLALPPAGAASAEEPAAVAVNPAAAGFNEGLTLQYFHERAEAVATGDGVYLGLGPLSFSSEWVRPSDAARYRRLGLGLGLGGPTFALGASWSWWSSPDAGLEPMRTFDIGATWRPARWLSVGAAGYDFGARLRGQDLPVRWQVGLATRQLDDSLTVFADWLGDDQARGVLRGRAVSAGATWETRFGLAVGGQVQVPTERGLTGLPGRTVFLLSLALNTRKAGLAVTAGGTGRRDEGSSSLGVRLSSRDYRGLALPSRAVLVDVSAEVEPPLRFPFPAPGDPWGRLLGKLRALRDDAEVGPVLVRIDRLPVGAGRAEELRAALQALGRAKPVVAWLQGGGLPEYYAATGARRVEMAPLGTLFLTGLSSGGLYLKDTLARVGVAFDVVQIGKYKSAGEGLSRSDMSEADREARASMLDDVFDRWVKAIAEARQLPEAKVRELVDQGIFDAEGARQAKLLDGLAYPDELERRLRLPTGAAGAWTPPQARAAQRWGPRPALAVVRVQGLIVTGKSRSTPFGPSLAGADTVAGLLRRAADDGAVRAIVVRVESPGGDALGSDLIWRAIQQARRKKPVVISMGDVAASGGYWVATAGDAVVAEPSTITGSIGVLAVKPDLSGLLGKVDAHDVTLKRGARADLFSPLRPWTADERAAVERNMTAAYELFLARVVEGRRISRDDAHAAGQGRAFTGQQALERKLVDRLGSFQDAVALARQRARIPPGEEVEIRRLEPSGGFLEGISSGLLVEDGASALLARVPGLGTALAVADMGPVVALPQDWLPGAPPPPTAPGKAP